MESSKLRYKPICLEDFLLGKYYHKLCVIHWRYYPDGKVERTIKLGTPSID